MVGQVGNSIRESCRSSGQQPAGLKDDLFGTRFGLDQPPTNQTSGQNSRLNAESQTTCCSIADWEHEANCVCRSVTVGGLQTSLDARLLPGHGTCSADPQGLARLDIPLRLRYAPLDAGALRLQLMRSGSRL